MLYTPTQKQIDAGALIWHSKPMAQKISEAEATLLAHQRRDPETWPGGQKRHAAVEQELADVVAWLKTPEAAEASRQELARLRGYTP